MLLTPTLLALLSCGSSIPVTVITFADLGCASSHDQRSVRTRLALSAGRADDVLLMCEDWVDEDSI